MRIITATLMIVAALALSACQTRNDGHNDKAPAQPSNVSLTELKARAGYGLSGPYDFIGELVWQGDHWQFEGRFEFPTAGYDVGDPRITILESYPEQVRVVLPVTPPPPDALVAQVITPVAVSAAIEVGHDASFTVDVRSTVPSVRSAPSISALWE